VLSFSDNLPRPQASGRGSLASSAEGMPMRIPIITSRQLLYSLWILSTLLVVIGSLLPAESQIVRAIGTLPVSTKVLHFFAYTWLGLVAFIAVRRRRYAVVAAVAMALMGIALEYGQRFIPGRTFEVRDMWINSVGVLTGALIVAARKVGSQK
jgi:VanZ family protein